MSDEALEALWELALEQEDFENTFDRGLYKDPDEDYNDN